MILTDAWRALKAGEELGNAESWKNRQATASAVAAVLGLVVVLLPKIGLKIDISGGDIATIAGGIAVVLGMLNSYLTTATSKRVGLPSKHETEPAAGVGD